MKKFELTVGDRSFEVRHEKSISEAFENNVPKIWADNMDKVVETDITQEIATQKTKAENLAMLQDLLSEPEIAVELEAKYRAILAEKRGES